MTPEFRYLDLLLDDGLLQLCPLYLLIWYVNKRDRPAKSQTHLQIQHFDLKSGLLCVRICQESVVLVLGLGHFLPQGLDVAPLSRVDFLERRDLGAERFPRSLGHPQPFRHLEILRLQFLDLFLQRGDRVLKSFPLLALGRGCGGGSLKSGSLTGIRHEET